MTQEKQSVVFDKILGCIMGGSIGASMGAAVEWVCLPSGGYKAIEKEYGWVETLLPWKQKKRQVRYWNSPLLQYYDMDLPAGMTEDGCELKFLMSKAIIEKKGPITAEDLANVWRRDINPDYIGYLINPHIRIFYDRLVAGGGMSRIPAKEVGKMTLWPGMVDAMMMVSPVGIINAGDPERAAWDAKEAASILQSPIGYGLDNCAAIASAIAESFNPNATVDSVVQAAKQYVADPVKEIIDEGVEMAQKYGDIKSIRDPYFEKYAMKPPFDGMEVLSESIALFYVTNGDPKDTIIGGTNFGRDTDCIGCVGGAIAGAFGGSSKIPQEWMDTVEQAIAQNEHTVHDYSLYDSAVGLYESLVSSVKKETARVKSLESLGLDS